MWIILSLLLILVPVSYTTAQYLPPEQVLMENAASGPKNSRAVQSAEAEQERKRSAARQEAETSSAPAAPTSSADSSAATTAPSLHPSPPDTPPGDPEQEPLDPITARWLERLRKQGSLNAGLHSGPDSPSQVPLAGTGPASTAVLLAGIGAVFWTMYCSLTPGGLRAFRQRLERWTLQ